MDNGGKRLSPAVTARAFILGCILVAVTNVITLYSHYVLSGTLFACDYFPLAAGFPFILLLIIVNPALKLLEKLFRNRVRLVLSAGEIILITIMTLVGSTLPTFGLVGYFLGTISAPVHFADQANQWARYLLPHMPDWVIPRDREALRLFYNGLPEGASIPWGAWLIPLFWWTTFFIAFFFLCFFLVSMLRKQWVEEERLSFPISEVPAEMVRGLERPGRAVPDVLSSRLFWIGFALPAIVGAMKIIGFFYPGFPQIQLKYTPQMPTGFSGMWFWVVFPVIGFAFFGKLEILLSIWVFYLLFWTQSSIFSKIGYITGPSEPYCSRFPYSGYQSFGGLIVFVAVSFYLARRHLKAVFRQALNPATNAVDDSGEFVSCRSAVVGLALSLAYLVLWLYKSGMELHVIAVFLPAVLVIFLGITRAVLESGLIWLRGPLIAPAATLTLVGAPAMRAKSILSLFMTMGWHSDIKAFFMPAAAHSMRMSDNVGLKRRKVVWAIALAAIVAYVVSIVYTLNICYRNGAYSFHIHIFRNGAQWPAKEAKKVLSRRESYLSSRTRYEIVRAQVATLEDVKRGKPVGEAKAEIERARQRILSRPGVADTLAKLAQLQRILGALDRMTRAKAGSDESRAAVKAFEEESARIRAWEAKGRLKHAERKYVDFLKGLSASDLEKGTRREVVEVATIEAVERIKDREKSWVVQGKLAALDAREKALAAPAAGGAEEQLARLKAELATLEHSLPSSRPWAHVMFTLIGAGIAVVLYMLRFAFPWWPVHPLGFAFAMVLPVELTFFSIFIAWLVKSIIMRSGGVRLYNAAKPFFLGLIFGEFFISGSGFFFDLIFFNELGARHFMYGW